MPDTPDVLPLFSYIILTAALGGGHACFQFQVWKRFSEVKSPALGMNLNLILSASRPRALFSIRHQPPGKHENTLHLGIELQRFKLKLREG